MGSLTVIVFTSPPSSFPTTIEHSQMHTTVNKVQQNTFEFIPCLHLVLCQQASISLRNPVGFNRNNFCREIISAPRRIDTHQPIDIRTPSVSSPKPFPAQCCCVSSSEILSQLLVDTVQLRGSRAQARRDHALIAV